MQNISSAAEIRAAVMIVRSARGLERRGKRRLNGRYGICRMRGVLMESICVLAENRKTLGEVNGWDGMKGE